MQYLYKNKEVYSKNTLPRYGSGFPITEDNKKRVEKLSGEWKFKFLETANDIPANFGDENFDDSDFGTINVPSEWQIANPDMYDKPMYTNIAYPYALGAKNLFNLPHINSKLTSAGLYSTTFDVKKLKDRYYLHFEGVNNNAEVYLNGHFVGYSEDTFDFQEYDVSDYIKQGENKLQVCVCRYCTGSYLEDQDMWRLSGIFRDVYLVNKPIKEIFDIYAHADFKESSLTSADLILDTKLDNANGCTLYVDVYNQRNEKIKTVSFDAQNGDNTGIIPFETLNLWSHENPYLYRLEFILKDGEEFCDKRVINFGFRKIEIVPMKDEKGPFILLNNKPLKFRGVNRHEFHPNYGHAVPVDLIYNDLQICKENNITAIRTSHYPNVKAFYDMCDKMGILVMCENNLETHGLSFMIPGNSKYWSEQCVYRINNMVNTFKNHACIISWSLGNESGFGQSFFDMKEAALKIDKTRFIHYEEDISGKCSEVFSEMYAVLEKMDKIGQNQPIMHEQTTVFKPLGVRYTPEKYRDLPFIQCEYAHCMGNSLGNFADYWKAFKKYDRLAGGFIWDFADQAIKYTNKDGVDEYRFGGDFGDKPNAGVFAFNGIVMADRKPNPALYEVRKVYQMVDFTLQGNSVVLENNHMFTNLKEYKVVFTYLLDGEFVKSDEMVLDMDFNPGMCMEVQLMKPENVSGELSVLVEVHNPHENDRVIAYEQFVLEKSKFELENLVGNVSCEETSSEIMCVVNDLRICIDKITGAITSIYKNNTERLHEPIKPNFVRATIDNDRWAQVNIDLVKTIMGVYKFHKEQKKLCPKTINLTVENGIAKIDINWKFKFGKLNTKYLIGENGIDLYMDVKPKTDLIRYGFSFGTRESVKNMQFYAKGPFENYCDRNNAAILSKYNGVAEDFNHDYLSPQENGNHTEARYLVLGEEGNGFIALAKEKPFEFGVLPYSYEVLENAEHRHEVVKDDHYIVTIDGKQRGVGGDIPAIACLKPDYKIRRNEQHSFAFRLIVR